MHEQKEHNLSFPFNPSVNKNSGLHSTVPRSEVGFEARPTLNQQSSNHDPDP